MGTYKYTYTLTPSTHTHTPEVTTRRCSAAELLLRPGKTACKVVRAMSTAHDPTLGSNVLHSQRDGSRIEVPCPVMIKDYNAYMGGVDSGFMFVFGFDNLESFKIIEFYREEIFNE